jgi:beta-lactam-binding protein with PASTA domain
VFQTEPPAGAVAALGSDVQVMVSKGPATTDVPDVVGKKAGDTGETLSGAGFVVADTTVFSDEPNGQVVSQSPAGGPSEAKGATSSRQNSIGPGASVRRRRSGSRRTVIRKQRRDLCTVSGRALRHGLLVDRFAAA